MSQCNDLLDGWVWFLLFFQRQSIDGMFRDRGSGALDGRWKIPFPCFVTFIV